MMQPPAPVQEKLPVPQPKAKTKKNEPKLSEMLFGDLRTTESTKVSVAQRLSDTLDGTSAPEVNIKGSTLGAKKEESKLNSPVKKAKSSIQTKLNVGQRKSQRKPTLVEVKEETPEVSKPK